MAWYGTVSSFTAGICAYSIANFIRLTHISQPFRMTLPFPTHPL